MPKSKQQENDRILYQLLIFSVVMIILGYIISYSSMMLKNGYASIRNGKVMIRVPQKCSRKRKLMIIDELYGKISNAIRKKPGSSQ